MADLTTLQTRLSQAETAYHKLLTGNLEETVQQDTGRVTYKAADAAKLQSYIEELKYQIASLGGTITGQRRRGLEVNL